METWVIIIIVLGSILGICTFIFSWFFAIKRTNDAIDLEIQNALEILDDPNYVWKNDDIFQKMRNELKGAILDLRKRYGNFKPTYKVKTERKRKELLKIVKKYYFDDIKIESL